MPARRPPLRLASIALGLLLAPLPAEAHSPVRGMGDFVSGFLHPVTSPSHALLLVGLSLLLGCRRPLPLRVMLTSFAPVSALALALTTAGWFSAVPQAILVALALVPAACLALAKLPPPPAMALLLACAAGAMGLDSAVEDAGAGGRFQVLLGTWVGLNLFLFDLAFYVSLATAARWFPTALRVAGSWLLAIATLVLAFTLRPGK